MKRDGQISIHISEDLLTATANLTPPATGGQALEIEEVEQEINARGITHGIDWETIRNSLYECNQNRQRINDITIASGTKPREQLPATLVFSPQIQTQSRIFRQIDSKGEYHPIGEDDAQLYETEIPEVGGRIDHRERNAIHVIHEGQVLAKRIPLRPGELGTGVTGEQLPFSEIEIKTLNPGLNTRTDDDKIVATVSGRLAWDKDQFGVDDKIEIKGDVGYATGNIRFPGNVLLSGEIQDGFRIWSGGNILSKSTIDAYEIFAKGDLISTEGILGKNKGVVRIKGRLEAKFIESCRVDVFGDIQLKTAVLNSRINSLASIRIPKGRIVGGQLRFAKNLEVNQLGNQAGVPTLIIGGANFVSIRQLEYARQRLEEMSSQEQSSRQEHERNPQPKTAKALAALEKEIMRLQKEVSDLLEQNVPDPEAEIICHGTIYSGTIIRFGAAERQISEDMNKQRVHFEADAGRIVIENI